MRLLLLFKNTYIFLVISTKYVGIQSKKISAFCLHTLFFSACFLASCQTPPIQVGAHATHEYFPLLLHKNTGVVANQTSVIFKDNFQKTHTHLVDSMQHAGIQVLRVFSPEHGFRGKADAAEQVADGTDKKTGIPIVSLYGKQKKPSPEQLESLDVMVFDIQDVGVRFYTYLSTLHYVMEACAENGIPLLVLDRPNPNGHYIDGPTLKMEHRSFVGMHPVPLVYGMTIGEYATMINGEQWLKNKVQCDLTVIPLQNYAHQTEVHLPIRPSPNLPNDRAINLYPSLGFFEGTTINAGRGSEFQFQRYGAPWFPSTDFSYIPEPNFGAKYPKHENKICFGVDLSQHKKMAKVTIAWLQDAYDKTPNKEKFFGKTFTIHAGTTLLRQQLENKASAKTIEASCGKDLKKFKKTRAKYLLYP
jgi:uncharacterized protein YbbC (DUF1343 family)